MRHLKGAAFSDDRDITIIRVAWKIYKQIAAIANRVGYTRMQFFCCRTNKFELQLGMALYGHLTPLRRNPILQVFAHRKGFVFKSASG
ncbi:hypothetical protein D3C81_1554540 [compost metagenome]